MTRIVYSYSGEGSGHSSRASEIARYLLDQGHQVRLASYGRGYQNLKNEFDVLEIEGLTIASTDNRIDKLATLRDNLRRLPAGKKSLNELRQLFAEFQPHAVVCDFEPLTAYLAEHYRVPLISLDNQHRMRYVKHQPPPERESQAAFTRRLIRVMVPWPSVSLIVALVDGVPSNDRSFVFPPLVKREVRDCVPVATTNTKPDPNAQAHVLVYLTQGYDSVLEVLRQLPHEQFFIYGYDRDTSDGNLRFFKNSGAGFVTHLAASKAGLATAGFTLISEALYLGKPYFALPMGGHYEQELNAWQLQESGYGAYAEQPTVQALSRFFQQLDTFRQQLASYPRDDGRALKNKLDELLHNDAALAARYKAQRTV